MVSWKNYFLYGTLKSEIEAEEEAKKVSEMLSEIGIHKNFAPT